MTDFGDFNPKYALFFAISVFMSSLNFMLSIVEHEKSIITSEPGIAGLIIATTYNPSSNLAASLEFFPIFSRL